jgi:hypothetical protein
MFHPVDMAFGQDARIMTEKYQSFYEGTSSVKVLL